MLSTAALVLLTAVPLKVLVQAGNDEFLPPQADPTRFELQVLEAFATSQGQPMELVPVDTFAELIPSLLAGKGDVIAAGLTVTDARRKLVTFTRPTQAVDELLVGKKGAAKLPKTVKDLAGRTVVVPKGSAFVETLAAISGVNVIERDNLATADQLAFELARGEFDLTVLDSVRLEAMKHYLPELEARFPLAQERGLAFALRPNDEALRAKLDSFLIEKAFRAGVTDATGDLDAIKKRGTLRVLTRNNAVSFYLYKGNRDGFDYELAKGFAKSQGLTLEIVLAPSYDALLPMLKAGRGDFIAASLTATPERAKEVDFTKPYLS
jgi:membrane-bound lytic murein transglycosylase F